MKTINNFCLFTVDVEEWWSVHSFEKYANARNINRANFDDRMAVGIEKLLILLKEYQIPAIFFVLGRVAEAYPELITNILNAGHEIGTHGYEHKLVYNQTPEEFEEDLVKSITTIQNITGKKIDKYRAPSYSITLKSLWALPLLEKTGIKYDFSLFPLKNNRFGVPSAPREPYQINLNESGGKYLIEIPPNIIDLKLIKLPINSGFGFRFFPLFMIKKNLKYLLKKGTLPNLIIHNWELDPYHPRLKAGFTAEMIHYYNISKTENKLIELFKAFNFYSLEEMSNPVKEIYYSEII
jgi:polysaccharide deacetylase family protein (PEP-CTERM system associated)